jgi:hypothetical protein
MISARIPFSGFYCSFWDGQIDNWVEQQAEYRGHNLEDVYDAADFSAARLDIANAYAAEFIDWLGGTLDREVKGEFEQLTSPRFYNFETDRIFVKLEEAALQQILDDLRAKDDETLQTAFATLFTSRDGFVSFYEPFVPAKPLAEWDHNEVFALLQAWVEHNAIEDLDLELYDRRIGGLYEKVDHACDNCVDWAKLGLANAE